MWLSQKKEANISLATRSGTGSIHRVNFKSIRDVGLCTFDTDPTEAARQVGDMWASFMHNMKLRVGKKQAEPI
jgi:hypothetical protein